jgi:hypothetical protein
LLEEALARSFVNKRFWDGDLVRSATDLSYLFPSVAPGKTASLKRRISKWLAPRRAITTVFSRYKFGRRSKMLREHYERIAH